MEAVAKCLKPILLLQVTNPHGKRIYSTLQQTEDKFSFKARYAGRYQFCLTLSSGNGLGVALGSGNR